MLQMRATNSLNDIDNVFVTSFRDLSMYQLSICIQDRFQAATILHHVSYGVSATGSPGCATDISSGSTSNASDTTRFSGKGYSIVGHCFGLFVRHLQACNRSTTPRNSRE